MVGRNSGRAPGRAPGRVKSREISASVTKRKRYEKTKANKSKKNDGDSTASDTETTTVPRRSFQSYEKVLKLSTITINNDKEHQDVAINSPQSSPNAGTKTTGLDDGYEANTSDTTPKRCSLFKTRISFNFFVLPSENEVDQKLYTVARKWMAKMLENDKEIALLPWYDCGIGEDSV